MNVHIQTNHGMLLAQSNFHHNFHFQQVLRRFSSAPSFFRVSAPNNPEEIVLFSINIFAVFSVTDSLIKQIDLKEWLVNWCQESCSGATKGSCSVVSYGLALNIPQLLYHRNCKIFQWCSSAQAANELNPARKLGLLVFGLVSRPLPSKAKRSPDESAETKKVIGTSPGRFHWCSSTKRKNHSDVL